MGAKVRVSFDVSTDRPEELELIAGSRPARYGPCRQSPSEDFRAVGSGQNETYGLQSSDNGNPVNGSAHFEIDHVWRQVAPFVICAWLQGGNSEGFATAAAETNVREPTGQLKITARAIDASDIGSWIAVRFRGGAEGPHEVTGRLLRPSRSCPKKPGGPSLDTFTDFGRDAPFSGAFDRTLRSGRFHRFGKFRVCGYLMRRTSSIPTAAASVLFEHRRFKPRVIAPPRIVIGDTGRRTRLDCLTGTWTAYPQKTGFRFRWRRNGKLIRGARRARYFTSRSGRLRCSVTARNNEGSTTRWTAPFDF